MSVELRKTTEKVDDPNAADGGPERVFLNKLFDKWIVGKECREGVCPVGRRCTANGRGDPSRRSLFTFGWGVVGAPKISSIVLVAHARSDLP